MTHVLRRYPPGVTESQVAATWGVKCLPPETQVSATRDSSVCHLRLKCLPPETQVSAT
jgi:hypothetical protein